MSNRWESEILRFEEEDRVSPPAPGGIVFAGSSTFRLWSNLAAVFPQYGVINRGFGGARVHDVTAYAVRTVAPYKPRQVIVYTGGNDLAKGTTPKELVQEFVECISTMASAAPGARISVMSILPHLKFLPFFDAIQETNDAIKAHIMGTPGSSFIDTYTAFMSLGNPPPSYLFQEDEIHLSQEGYTLLQKITQPNLLPKPKEISET